MFGLYLKKDPIRRKQRSSSGSSRKLVRGSVAWQPTTLWRVLKQATTIKDQVGRPAMRPLVASAAGEEKRKKEGRREMAMLVVVVSNTSEQGWQLTRGQPGWWISSA